MGQATLSLGHLHNVTSNPPILTNGSYHLDGPGHDRMTIDPARKWVTFWVTNG